MVLQTAIVGHIFIYVQIKHQYIISYIYLTTGEKLQALKRCSTVTVRKCLPEGPSRSGVIGEPDNLSQSGLELGHLVNGR